MAYPFTPTSTGPMLYHTPGVTGRGFRLELVASPRRRSLSQSAHHTHEDGRESRALPQLAGAADGVEFIVDDFRMPSDPSTTVPREFTVMVRRSSGESFAYRFLESAAESMLQGAHLRPSAGAPEVADALKGAASFFAGPLLQIGRRLGAKGRKRHANLPAVAGWTFAIDTSTSPWIVESASQSSS